MNQIVGQLSPGHGSRINIVSLDIFPYVELLDKNDWPAVAEFLLQGVHQLVKTGIDFLLLASNTGKYTSFSLQVLILDLAHIAAPKIMEIYPDLVFLHISDAVAYEIKRKNLKKVPREKLWAEQSFVRLAF